LAAILQAILQTLAVAERSRGARSSVAILQANS